MARLTSRNFTSLEAAEFIARSSQPHTVQWQATAVRYQGGEVETLLTNVPIVGGRLLLDSSNSVRRQLTLEVGGGEDFVAETSNDPLVPFGQVIVLSVRLDFSDGSWSPWLKMGEFPVVSYVYERPSQIATVEAADYSYTVEEFLHQSKHSYKGRTVRNAIVDMVQAAIPDKVFNVDASDSAKDTKVDNYVADAGIGRWTTATELASIKGHEAFFDSLGNLVIRRDVTDDADESIPGNGPDIGTASNPVATVRDGEGGNMVASTATVTREGACNGVFILLHETADQKKKRKVRGDDRRHVLVSRTVDSGSVTWGDKFGRVPIVEERNVKKITDALVNNYEQRAKRILHRRRGLVRYIDLDAAGLYWLEPDDKVAIRWDHDTADPRVEAHYAQRVEFDLSGRNPVRIRTRQLSVTDPGV